MHLGQRLFSHPPSDLIFFGGDLAACLILILFSSSHFFTAGDQRSTGKEIFPARASLQQPVIHIPGLNVQLFGYFISVHIWVRFLPL